MANQTVEPDSIGIDVRNVAKLASLDLSNEQIEKLAPQLEEIIGYIAMLNSVETGHIEATARVTDLENITRDDKFGKSLTQEEALSNAKTTENGMVKVNAILDNE